MLCYVLLLGSFCLGYFAAALMFAAGQADAEMYEVRPEQDSDSLIYAMKFADPHDTDEVIKVLNAGAREIERLTEPCPVHPDEPCIRWFWRKACGHCTEDDLLRYLAEGRALK